jgi:hypothetical protein
MSPVRLEGVKALSKSGYRFKRILKNRNQVRYTLALINRSVIFLLKNAILAVLIHQIRVICVRLLDSYKLIEKNNSNYSY